MNNFQRAFIKYAEKFGETISKPIFFSSEEYAAAVERAIEAGKPMKLYIRESDDFTDGDFDFFNESETIPEGYILDSTPVEGRY